MSNKDVEFIAKGLVLDNAVDDMIRALSTFNTVDGDKIYEDYKYFKPCIVSCSQLYRFFMIRLTSTENVVVNYNEFKSQADYGTLKYIDYIVADFTRGTLMDNLPEEEIRFINKSLSERLMTTNNTLQ